MEHIRESSPTVEVLLLYNITAEGSLELGIELEMRVLELARTIDEMLE